jgi:hypothetical protein
VIQHCPKEVYSSDQQTGRFLGRPVFVWNWPPIQVPRAYLFYIFRFFFESSYDKSCSFAYVVLVRSLASGSVDETVCMASSLFSATKLSPPFFIHFLKLYSRIFGVEHRKLHCLV